jgi:hypothetical protein
MQKKLINFNADQNTINTFDAICHANGRTRTSVLVELVTSYILNESKAVSKRVSEFNKIKRALEENLISGGDEGFRRPRSQRNRMAAENASYPDYAPPEFLFSDGQEDW